MNAPRQRGGDRSTEGFGCRCSLEGGSPGDASQPQYQRRDGGRVPPLWQLIDSLGRYRSGQTCLVGHLIKSRHLSVCDPYDGLVERRVTVRALECGVPVGEDATVAGH